MAYSVGLTCKLIGTALLATILSAQPIALHPRNPHYFLFQGKVVALVTSGEHYGAVLNADFDFKQYLATLAKDKLNYTRLFGGAYVEVPAQSFGIQRNNLAPGPDRYLAPWVRSTVSGYAGGGNKFDLTQWDPAFFERYHAFLAEALRQGIVVEITLFSSHYDEKQWNISALHTNNNVNQTAAIDWKNAQTLDNGNILAFQEQYTRKLVREANQFDNVIFEIQNEPWSDHPELVDVVNPYLPVASRDKYPNSIEVSDAKSIAWQTRVAEWIQSEESSLPKKHLLAQNYCNFRFPVRSTIPGVSIVNFHYAYPDAVYENYGLNKALSYDETGFVGHADATYRRQAWNFMLSGGSTFDSLDYSFSVGHESGDDSEPNGPGGGSAALRHQLGILRDFLADLPLADLTPDRTSVVQASGVHAHLLSLPGKVYALYLDGKGPTEITLTLPPGAYSGDWIDPATGAVLRKESFRHKNGTKMLNSPEFAEGVALRLTGQPPR